MGVRKRAKFGKARTSMERPIMRCQGNMLRKTFQNGGSDAQINPQMRDCPKRLVLAHQRSVNQKPYVALKGGGGGR